ncbi:hypothetical protein AAG747_20610 [Rapidithrix thailandica]|uniref:Uncharacterized protein n=1 Tax=Rapidithrix thailandica TaxID=413964 RepID=A0AAW9SD02_9BACT
MAILNTMLFAMIYLVIIGFLLSQTIAKPRNNRDNNDGDQGGDGGWDNSDDVPPLDLPPGVYILPPDVEDPSKSPIEDDALA